MSIYILSFITRLIRVVDFLINHVFFHHRMLHLPSKFGSLNDEEEIQCAICLSKVEDDDEIRELRCDHFFHSNCLDKWFSYRHTTCPLCRDNLVVPPKIDGTTGSQEMLFFNFCRTTTSSDDDDGTWLLS
ncbi:Zinc finger, RING-CH-type [Cynara cardunculus var. scolymus]|uniref:Zinc finger, RING-CH-type n=1 Tax=Cynara cardunculus var. scolymus TaxID=59895 RepID=A0A103XV86_CYNCS|nr:Zinc finger, RING-CH-type [Cynara cardunculus var. scolymus]